MKVRQLSTVHAVGDTRVLHKECKSLLAAGYDVALIASHQGDEVVEGVPVLGIGTAPNRLWRMTVSAARLLRRALAEDADIYHFHDPELIGVGLLLRLRGKKVVYDVHEDVPKQIMNKFWIAEPFKRPLAVAATLAEKAAAAGLSGVVTATPSIAEKFPPGKTVVVQNFPEADLADEVSGTPFPERRNAFVYVGGLSEQQGLFEMLDAFTRLPDGLTGVLAGKFKQKEREARAHPGWSRVRYPGVVGRTQVVRELRDAVCGLVLDHPITNYVDAYSTKMFEYLACGIPVICSDFPLWVELVERYQCGVALDPFDTEQVAEWILRYHTDPELARTHGENGRRAIADHLNWRIEFAKLSDLYGRICP
ncbi:MAG: glycosyltransferase [Actinomycetia bacterium]|nr:glycosyltransferase [Actinomycetes bacterium]